jgi:tetratricopeptide (TPR) repeat protein
MAVKKNLLALVEHVARIERELVGDLTAQDRSGTGEPTRWSPKDLVGHVTAWQQNLVQMLWAGGGHQEFQTVEAVDHANAMIFEAYRDLSWAEVLDFADRARQSLRGFLEPIADEELSDPARFVWLNGQPLWRRVAGNAVVHPILHYAQFTAERGAPEKALRLQEEIGDRLLALDEDPVWQGTTKYNLACAYALSGMKERAIRLLREGLRLNPDLREWSKQDPDFEAIREDPGFKAIYETG